MRAIEFLMKVWGHTCEEGDYVFLSTKSRPANNWRDHYLEFKPGIKKKLREFLQEYNPKSNDIYFCPLGFKGKKRRKPLVRPVNVLWSDIDDGNPKIKPTILWESSPGRLQGLWFLRSKLDPQDGADLNKSLTYYMDADKGGWDLTQVLRVPGTYNHKYATLPAVRVIDCDFSRTFSAAKIRRRIGHADSSKEKNSGALSGSSSLTFEQIFSKYRRKIPPKVKQLLSAKTATQGKRSDIIWYIENTLSDIGIPPPEIITLIKNSVWNKYKGRSTEDEQLNRELKKIVEKDIDVPKESKAEAEVEEAITEGLTVESFSEVMTSRSASPGWLVKDYWLKNSHGIVAGEPKSFKSTLALDLCISVASGEPFHGNEVHHPGPVVYIQNENATWIMKDRMEKMANDKGLIGAVHREDDKISVEWPQDIPLHFVNNSGFLLTDPVHQQLFEKILEQYKPVLVVLDPLYLMFDGDINSAKDLASTLSWLLECRYKYNTGIMVIHHYNKGGAATTSRGGQRMLGSTTLHGWIESAWYIQADTSEDEIDEGQEHSALITLQREFRGSGIVPKLDFSITMGDVGEPVYSVEIDKHTPPAEKKKKPSSTPQTIEEDILAFMKTRKKGTTENQLIKATGYSKDQIREAIDRMAEKGALKRQDGKII